MDEESAPFNEFLTEVSAVSTPLAGVSARRGRLAVGDGGAIDAVLVTSNIGLVAAASAASWATGEFAPAAVISAGTGGGLPADISVGDIAVAEACTYGTADATEFGYERGQVPRQPVRFESSPELVAAALAGIPGSSAGALRVGRILSGDTFVTTRNVADMREAFPDAVATDMESCAISQTASAFGVPFISVRGISDLCGPSAGQDFHMGVDEAAAHSRDAVRALLAAL
ncbi:5'-methylthioadenosine/S-adenosylhomocysteine nucleosidase [Gulosibacter molinativorax]|uniref:adenosylhomocysteine nucleosidase n=2 Tax=Gulosibacter molinativorax TaxID=256821 RepID=A0ABT7CAR4_9MICO|nr:5'-methylthioadenosine/S-adenosylhomocysteine nucleosidase [Gulosibacter molinativorax]